MRISLNTNPFQINECTNMLNRWKWSSTLAVAKWDNPLTNPTSFLSFLPAPNKIRVHYFHRSIFYCFWIVSRRHYTDLLFGDFELWLLISQREIVSRFLFCSISIPMSVFPFQTATLQVQFDKLKITMEYNNSQA